MTPDTSELIFSMLPSVIVSLFIEMVESINVFVVVVVVVDDDDVDDDDDVKLSLSHKNSISLGL